MTKMATAPIEAPPTNMATMPARPPGRASSSGASGVGSGVAVGIMVGSGVGVEVGTGSGFAGEASTAVNTPKSADACAVRVTVPLVLVVRLAGMIWYPVPSYLTI